MATIKASAFEPRVGYCELAYQPNQTSSAVDNWVGRQGKHWPSHLNGSAIAPNLGLVYLPYWVMSGDGLATWTASIGIDRKEMAPCRKCNGTGRTLVVGERQICDTCHGNGQVAVTNTYWQRHQDIVKAELKGRVIDNHNYAIHCGN